MNNCMRNVVHLNDDWRYMPDFRDEYPGKDFNDSEFRTVRIPHANIELPYNNFDEEMYQFVSCYRRKLFIGSEHAGKRAVLCFEGVMTYARVYFNGELVCDHPGGYTPFRCDVTEHLIYGGDNVIAVMVDSTERKDIPPFGFTVDYLTYGGIYREVSLEFTSPVSVENVFARTKNVLSDDKLLDMDVYISNKSMEKGKVKIKFTLGTAEEKGIEFDKTVELNGEPEEKFKIMQQVGNVKLWDVRDPFLYTLSVKLEGQQGEMDAWSARIGFREAVFRQEGFYLNGERIKLLGLNRHQSYPYVGYAMPKGAQYKDAEILKEELGVNLVRLSHYPQSGHFMDRCDELGLLVFEEIPGWQHIGDEKWKELSVRNVEDMIKRDWNRPSVIIWGVRINESQDDDEFYRKTNKMAEMLDDTRSTGGVRNFEFSNLLEDVYTYNDFIHKGNNEPLHRAGKVTKKKVPYLVTEHNGHMYPTKKFDSESRRLEHALRHARVINRMYEDKNISGAIGWCMFDYNTHMEFGNGDKICYHGVMDMFRLPKEAAAVYASQQDGKPVMEVLSSMNRGEREGSELDSVYVFTNCDYIKLYKNEDYIGTYYPDREAFPGLPHPPVIITDFIGTSLERNERFNKRDAEVIKNILLAVAKYGNKALPLKHKLNMLKLMLKLKMPYKEGVELHSRYVANWGSKALEFEFVGYKDDVPVKNVKKGPSSSKELLVLPDKLVLVEEETYDVCRIVLKHVDQRGNVMDFSSEVVSLGIEGPGEIIGPESLALISGSVAFWVKTTGEAGNIKVTITSKRFEAKEIYLKVEKKVPV